MKRLLLAIPFLFAGFASAETDQPLCMNDKYTDQMMEGMEMHVVAEAITPEGYEVHWYANHRGEWLATYTNRHRSPPLVCIVGGGTGFRLTMIMGPLKSDV